MIVRSISALVFSTETLVPSANFAWPLIAASPAGARLYGAPRSSATLHHSWHCRSETAGHRGPTGSRQVRGRGTRRPRPVRAQWPRGGRASVRAGLRSSVAVMLVRHVRSRRIQSGSDGAAERVGDGNDDLVRHDGKRGGEMVRREERDCDGDVLALAAQTRRAPGVIGKDRGRSESAAWITRGAPDHGEAGIGGPAGARASRPPPGPGAEHRVVAVFRSAVRHGKVGVASSVWPQKLRRRAQGRRRPRRSPGSSSQATSERASS